MGNAHKDFSFRIGEINTNKQGYKLEIVEYFSAINISVKIDNKYIVSNIKYDHFKSRSIRNPYHPSVFGVGYFGIGKYSSRDTFGKTTQVYRTWQHLIRRGYCIKLKEKQPTYRDTTVCEEWHNFQNFAQWFEDNYKPDYMERWHLDKDILVKGNKVYSPETCCFVPNEINVVFAKRQNYRGKYPLGVNKNHNKYLSKICMYNKQVRLGSYFTIEEAFQAYKMAKEKYIKEIASIYKDKIAEKTYTSMCDYIVEITD